MKIGYNEATAMKKSSLALDLEYCEKYNYDYIEIRLDMLLEYLKTYTVKDLKEFFAKSHLKPYAFNSIENINFCDEQQWEELLSLFQFGCEMAKELNNPYMVVVPTMGDTMKDKTYQEVFDDSVKVLKELAEIAKPYGVKLAFEPIGDPRWCVRSIKQAWEIVKEVNRDDVGLVVDAFNLFMYKKLEDMEDIKEVPLEKIFVFHIDDSEDLPLDKLDHCHRLFPGDGVIRLKELVQLLKDKGYTEIASVEIFRPEYWEMDVEEVIRQGYEKTKRVTS